MSEEANGSRRRAAAKPAGKSRKKRRGARCPVCGKPPTERFLPFCSGRCKDVDLARWFTGSYRIPTDERPDSGATPPPEDDGEAPD